MALTFEDVVADGIDVAMRSGAVTDRLTAT